VAGNQGETFRGKPKRGFKKEKKRKKIKVGVKKPWTEWKGR